MFTPPVNLVVSFEVECQEGSWKEAGEQGRAQAYPPGWTKFSLTGTEITCRDLHGTMCRWGLMDVVMVMMTIIQILSYLYAPGRPVLLLVIWLNLRGDPPSWVYSVLFSHAWGRVPLPLHHSNQHTFSSVLDTQEGTEEKGDCQEVPGPSWHGGQGQRLGLAQGIPSNRKYPSPWGGKIMKGLCSFDVLCLFQKRI